MNMTQNVDNGTHLNLLRFIPIAAKYDSVASEMEKTAAGLALVQDFADGLKAFNLVASITRFSTFLGAFGALFSILSNFFDSIEVQKLDNLLKVVNKGFLRMESKLEGLEFRVEDVEHTIKREHFWTKLAPEIKKLHTVKERVLNVYNANSNMERKVAMTSLKSRKQFEKVFDAFLAIEGTFDGSFNGKTLCKTTMEFTKADLKRMRKIAMDLYIRLIQGASDLVVLEKLQKVSGLQDEVAKKLVKIYNLIQDCEEEVKTKAWKSQWKKDVERLLNLAEAKANTGRCPS